MNKIIRNIRLFIHGLFYGMKSADLTMEQQVDTSSEMGTVQTLETQQGVFADVLQRKETQEVKELRDETYRVYIESGHYEIVGDIKTDEDGNPYFTSVRGEKKSLLDVTPENIFMRKGDKLITIQDNWAIVKGAGEAIDEFIDNEGDIDAGAERYKLKVERDYIPKFKIEKYTTRLVIKHDNDYKGAGERMILEFYCSGYPRQFNKEDVFFIKECEELVSGKKKSEIIDFTELEFITEKAFMLDDIHLYKFADFHYLETINFDGHFIVRMSAFPVCNYVDLTAEYRMASVDEKYAKKAQKTDTFVVNPFTTDMVPEDTGEIQENLGETMRLTLK